MKKYIITFEKDGKLLNLFKDGKSYKNKSSAKKQVESLYRFYQGPFTIQEIESTCLCNHCGQTVIINDLKIVDSVVSSITTEE